MDLTKTGMKPDTKTLKQFKTKCLANLVIRKKVKQTQVGTLLPFLPRLQDQEELRQTLTLKELSKSVKEHSNNS